MEGFTEWHELGLAASAIHRDLSGMFQKRKAVQVDCKVGEITMRNEV